MFAIETLNLPHPSKTLERHTRGTVTRTTFRLYNSDLKHLLTYLPSRLMALAAGVRATGASANSLGGPGSILCSFPGPTQTNYGYLFFIEFFVDSFIVSTIYLVATGPS
jgi:hypothetical protein